MPEDSIISLQNPRIKNVTRLQQKASLRREQKLFVIEGRREVCLALRSGVIPHEIFICKEKYIPTIDYPIDFTIHSKLLTYISPEVYEKIAYRGNSEGVLMVAKTYENRLDDIQLSSLPLVLVLESVEKPGNLGAIMRTADAAAADVVIICDPHTDVFNPNVIRSSLGCIFTTPVAVCQTEELLLWLSQNNLTILLASLQAQSHYHEADFTIPTALIFGTESDGLSEIWYKKADNHLKIPMMGQIDSLNVSASVAILLYEAQRQRAFKQKSNTR